MKYLTCMVVVVSASAGTLVQAGQADSKGFIEDGSLVLTNRNYYFERDYRKGERSSAGRNAFKPFSERSGKREEWVDGVQADYKSGFTQGVVGFGLDAYSYNGFQLDSGGGRTGTMNLPVGDDGHPQDHFSKNGGVVKVRVSDTVLRYGSMTSEAPVIAAHGSRIFPATVTGLNIISNEFANLTLDLGYFTAASGSTETTNHGKLSTTYSPYTRVNDLDVNYVDYVGGVYKLSDSLSTSLYVSNFEDVWHQYYGNVNYTLPLNEDQALGFDFNIYKTLDSGEAKLGPINNTIWSLETKFNLSPAHSLMFAWQQVNGDTPFDFLGFGDRSSGDSIFVSNSVSWSDFNGPGEKSAQLRYDLNMKSYGVPGLTFMTRYIKGWDIDGSHAPQSSAFYQFYGDGAKHHELDIWVRYVVQSGPAAKLSFRLQHALHRANDAQGDGNIDETRFIVDYPLNIF